MISEQYSKHYPEPVVTPPGTPRTFFIWKKIFKPSQHVNGSSERKIKLVKKALFLKFQDEDTGELLAIRTVFSATKIRRKYDNFFNEVATLPVIKEAWKVLCSFAELNPGKKYIPYSIMDEWLESHNEIIPEIQKTLVQPAGKSLAEEWCKLLLNLINEPETTRTKLNEEYLVTAVAQNQEFFSRLGTYPPSGEQIDIALKDENHHLVVAGAGTGKTSTLMTKICWLTYKELAFPDDILMLVFNNSARKDLEEALAQRNIFGVKVKTFHSMGAEIIRSSICPEPDILEDATDPAFLYELILTFVEKLSGELKEKWYDLLVYYPDPVKSPAENKDENQYIRLTKSSLLIPLDPNVARVRSNEERIIADFLFRHQVKFEYEKDYPHSESSSKFRKYKPDFYLPDYDIYLEHQALNKEGKAPLHFTKTNQRDYVDKVAWQRETHREHGTTLIESFSWWFPENIWREKLFGVLYSHGIKLEPLSYIKLDEALYSRDRARQRYEVNRKKRLAKIFSTCLNLKSEAYGSEKPAAFAGANNERDKIALEIIDSIYQHYTQYKKEKNAIDFGDMISMASKLVDERKYRQAFKYIMVDEFQDASSSRMKLLNSLKAMDRHTRIIAVGDDWQSIYRFAGSVPTIMMEFKEKFPFAQVDFLTQTYRFSQPMVDISSDVVLHNPKQIKKAVRSEVPFELPVIELLSDTRRSSDKQLYLDQLKDILAEIQSKYGSKESPAGVYILERYNSNLPYQTEMQSIAYKFPLLNITWSSIHKAKGGERDFVILGGLRQNGSYTFPSSIDTDPVIEYYLPEQERMKWSEERRLFYVALTRARKKVWLLYNKEAPSDFIRELTDRDQWSKQGYVHYDKNEYQPVICPSCRRGVLSPRDGTNGRFYVCSANPLCDFTIEACPECREGVLNISSKGLIGECTNENCNHRVVLCKSCHTGYFIKKQNNQTKHAFYGCMQFSKSDCKGTKSFEEIQAILGER